MSVLLAALALLLAACGGGDGANNDQGSGTVSSTTTQAGADTNTTPPEGGDDTEPPPADTSVETTTTTAAEVSGPSATLEAIDSRGTVRIGVTSDVAPFRSIAGDGFETQLAAAVAALIAPDATVEFVEVSSSDRFVALAGGDIDILVGSEHTVSREGDAAFTQPYLVSGVVGLISADSGIQTTADLAGRTIGLRDGHITGRDMAAALDAAGISYNSETLFDAAQGVAGVANGTLDAYAAKWAEAVATIEREAPGLAIVPVDVLSNPLALATPGADSTFAQEVNAALQQVIADGTWLSLFEEWIGGTPPWTLDEMASVQPS